MIFNLFSGGVRPTVLASVMLSRVSEVTAATLGHITWLMQ